MLPKAILFDLDETLLDNAPARAVLAEACCHIAGAFAGLSAERLLSANQQVFSAYSAEALVAWALGKIDTPSFSTEAWRRTLLSCGVSDVRAPDFAFEVHSRLALNVRRLFCDAMPTLEGLKDSFMLGVVTNGAADLQRDKLHTTKLEPYFHAIAVSGDLGIVKPDAGIFEYILGELGVEPQDVWHVGDSLSSDVAGANALGMKSVWLNRTAVKRGLDDPEPAIEIHSLSDVLAQLSLYGWDHVRAGENSA